MLVGSMMRETNAREELASVTAAIGIISIV
jgi:hypothetical protein